jgi:Mycolic acid cyclopropane synthetase
MNTQDAAQVIAGLVKTHAGLDLPVRLRLWDGSEAGPAGGPVLVIKTPRALQRIGWRPGELGLARAYVSGDLEVEGDLTEGLRQALGTRPRVSPARWAPAAWAGIKAAAELKILGPPPPPPACELHVRGRLHSRARDRAVIAGHYDVTAAFYQLILDPSLAYSCAWWDGAHTLAGAQRAKLELICGKLKLQPGRGGPFIESYITPDMHMRPVGETVALIEAAGLEVVDVQAMREHYVTTIRAWLDNFEQNLPAITALLTSEQVRVWRLYLAGGALSF